MEKRRDAGRKRGEIEFIDYMHTHARTLRGGSGGKKRNDNGYKLVLSTHATRARASTTLPADYNAKTFSLTTLFGVSTWPACSDDVSHSDVDGPNKRMTKKKSERIG